MKYFSYLALPFIFSLSTLHAAPGNVSPAPKAPLANLKDDFFSPHWELSLGFPGLLELRLKAPLSRTSSFGASFGFLPLSAALPPSQREWTQPFSDRFDTLVVPNLTAYNASLFYQRRGAYGWFWEPQLNLLVIRGGGEAFLRDPETKRHTLVSEITFRYYQLLGGISGGYSWTKAQGAWRFELGAGLSYSVFNSIQLETKGALPSFLALAPEYQKTITDDTADLENDLIKTIENSGLIKKIVPTFFIRWSW